MIIARVERLAILGHNGGEASASSGRSKCQDKSQSNELDSIEMLPDLPNGVTVRLGPRVCIQLSRKAAARQGLFQLGNNLCDTVLPEGLLQIFRWRIRVPIAL